MTGRTAILSSLYAALAVCAGAGTGACTSTPADLPMEPDGKEAIYSMLSQGSQDKADEALADIWDIGPRAPVVHLSPITWNDNPFDKYWRFIFYGLRPLSNLLHAYYTTGNVAYRSKLLEVIRSYDAFEVERGDATHPYLDDPHTSAFRAMMLVNIYGKLSRSHDLPADVATGMRASIAKVGAFLARDENFQDGENHGFNEAAALLVTAVNFPDLPDAAAWQATALDRLQRLAGDTIDDDGVEIENSPFYHFYVLSFAQEDALWMKKYGVSAPDGFDARIASMFDYATYSTQPDGYAPLLGASVSLNVHKLLPTVYSKNALDDPAGIEDGTPAFTFIRELGAGGTAPTDVNKRFPVSGQSFLRSSFGTKKDFSSETWMSFNVGNYRSAHNHFDALGMTYFANGKVVLPDAGLYEYESASNPLPFPTYFKSTRAHNTVVVDGTDQAAGTDQVLGGAVLQGNDWRYQSGSHTLYPGVTHRRAVLVLKRDVSLVLDSLESDVTHDYVQTWHFNPDATLTQSGLDLVATDNAGNIEIAMHQGVVDGVTVNLLKGQETPVVQGFYSEKYDKKVANYAAEYLHTAAHATFATLLTSGPYASAKTTLTASFDTSTGDVNAIVCVDDAKLTVLANSLAADGENVTVNESHDCP